MSFDAAGFIRAQTRISAPPFVPEVELYLADEVTPLWQATEVELEQNNLPPPFWAFAWAGGQGMARHILDNPEVVRGKRVVDFATGSGLVAIAAMKAGADSVLAVDIDPFALAAAEMNAAHNQVVVEICSGVDLTCAYKKADVVLAGDICYQQQVATTVTRWLRLCAGAGKEVFLADPGRAYVPDVGMEQIISYEIPTLREIEDSDRRTVTVWRMTTVNDGG
ncbi:MAG: methyltransferase [Alphaproteobacteria bacterium]|nr:methyltransferase [Alphaproteobacteria bacterium]